MEAYAKPIRELVNALSWFVREEALKFFHIITSAELRSTAIRLAMSTELHADNQCRFLFVEDASFQPDEGWSERLVVVFAPSRIESAETLREKVNTLVETPAFTTIRWIIVDPEPPTFLPKVERLGNRAMRFDMHANEVDVQRELAHMLDVMANVPPDAAGAARIGAAWPRGISPPHRRDSPHFDPEGIETLLKEEGISLPLAGPRGNELSQLILRGALAMRRGDTSIAIQQQTRARALCIDAGLPREATLMQLVLGAYLATANDIQPAMDLYRGTSTFAEKNGFRDLAVQAELALGALLLREGRPDEAQAVYHHAANLATEAAMPDVAEQALRLAEMVSASS